MEVLETFYQAHLLPVDETRIDMKLKNNICDRCTKDKLPIKMFSTENNMDPGVVPPAYYNIRVYRVIFS
jgi:hypothetical protein